MVTCIGIIFYAKIGKLRHYDLPLSGTQDEIIPMAILNSDLYSSVSLTVEAVKDVDGFLDTGIVVAVYFGVKGDDRA